MSELQKKIGEDGEELVLAFFKRIGWKGLLTNIELKCLSPGEHKLPTSKNPRSEHGIDAFFSYICPYAPNVRRNILISIKNSNYERTTPKPSTINKDLRDLASAMECFELSELRARIMAQGGSNQEETYGALIRIDRNPKIDQTATDRDFNFTTQSGTTQPLFFIENSRFDFIDSCMHYVETNLGDRTNTFNIPRTSLTVGGETRKFENPFLPFNCLVGGPVVMRSQLDQSKMLVIFCNEPFSICAFQRLVGLAANCTDGWPSEVRLVFDGYNRTFEFEIEREISLLQHAPFADSIRCDSFEIRSRLK